MLAALWDSQPDGSVVCRLCAHRCRLRKGAKGICGVRVNLRGELVSLVSRVVTAVGMDPVEKKPLYHFLPGSQIFSVGSAGCNFSCKFCQNSSIAHVPENGIVPGKRAAPEDLLALALNNHAQSMAFTYNEPTVFFELLYETAGIAAKKGIRSVLVTNGYMSKDCLSALSRCICAANVDLKSFSEDFYRKYCGAHLQPVLENLKAIKKLGWWLEVTTLVIPGVNDSPAELADLAAFIRDELGPETPWHVSGFHGAHLMANHPDTPLATLEASRNIGRQAGLQHVYIGNARSALGSNTFCPSCGAVVIERDVYATRLHGVGGKCPSCGEQIPGVWK